MDDLESRKKLILANWNMLSEPTKELLRSIGINGDKQENISLKQHTSKGVQMLLSGGTQ